MRSLETWEHDPVVQTLPAAVTVLHTAMEQAPITITSDSVTMSYYFYSQYLSINGFPYPSPDQTPYERQAEILEESKDAFRTYIAATSEFSSRLKREIDVDRYCMLQTEMSFDRSVITDLQRGITESLGTVIVEYLAADEDWLRQDRKTAIKILSAARAIVSTASKQ